MAGDAMFDHMSDEDVQNEALRLKGTFGWTDILLKEIVLRHARRNAAAKRALARKAIPLPWVKPLHIGRL
jgi:hypothetical protein